MKSLNFLSDQFVFWNLKKISHGYLILTDSRNKKHFFGNKASSLRATVKINDPSFSSKLLRKGSSGLGESYINNEFETEDLPSLIEISAKNINITYKFSGFFQFDLLSNFLKKNKFSNTKTRSEKNIAFHYDLGNEFYKLWLDPSMTYSSGIFTNSNKDLHIAQQNKYRQIANNLNLNENSNETRQP